ncbi:MAG: hypothetical protein DMF62_14560 [Acidobacteria bacterium]|nr:MAG: hypothetical protein DMF62_14560 [Acidobacteriota bacterium]
MKNAELVRAEENDLNETAEETNVLDFSGTLRELRKHVDPNLVRQREGWRDRNGNVRTVDYIEWHTVADILDETAPNWAHSVKYIRVFGDLIAVTVAITIDGVTREGIGTGLTGSEMGIKKAEHDALKRAAVKFGIARDLYKKEFDTFDQTETPDAVPEKLQFPSDPIAKTISDMVTTKQLGMIRSICREHELEPDQECMATMNCKVNELSRKAASSLIDHLLATASPVVPIRRAG